MSASTTRSGACPSCGASLATLSNFCSQCGVALTPAPCDVCGTPLPRGARFCHQCGTPALPSARRRLGRMRRALTRPAVQMLGVVTMITISASVVVFIALGVGRRSASAATEGGFVATQQGIVPAPDISSMSARERAARLYNRVTRLHEERKDDSVAFFAPMAIAAFAAIPDLDAEGQHQLARIESIAGERAHAVPENRSLRENTKAFEHLRATGTR